jgi:hypothetical protein
MKPAPDHHPAAAERRRQERKIWRMGILLSVAVHLLLFLGWQGPVIPTSPFSAAGPRAGDYRAAGGSMNALNLSVPPSRPIIRPPVPLAVEVEVEPVVIASDPAPDIAAVLGEAPGRGTGTGSGDASGAGPGRGAGGNADEGRYRLEPPTPRGMIIPPANKNLKGTTVEVWVFVDASGKVVPDSTRLNPPTKDRSFNQRLIREAAEWVFRPATQAGQAVASWFPYQISM